MTIRLEPKRADSDLDVPGDTNEDDPFDVIGHLNELREQRISALEEVIAARWPRRWLLSLRLRRHLRRSVRGYDWASAVSMNVRRF
jgi:hypothetical protein